MWHFASKSCKSGFFLNWGGGQICSMLADLSRYNVSFLSISALYIGEHAVPLTFYAVYSIMVYNL